MPTNAKLYISLVSAAGITAMGYAFLDLPRPHNLARFGACFLLALLAATLKLRWPGLTGTMSIGFVFVLLGISELPLPETMLIACAGVAVQCLWRAKAKPTPVQVLFSISAVATALLLAYGGSRFVGTQFRTDSVLITTTVATAIYFMANSLLVSGVLSLIKREAFRAVWQQCYLCAFPYYLLGGVVAGLMVAAGRELGWAPPLLILPVMGLAFLFYRIHLGRLEMLPAAAVTGASLKTVSTRSA